MKILKAKTLLKAAILLIPLALLTNCAARIGTVAYTDDYYPYNYPYPYTHIYGSFGVPADHYHHRHHHHR